MCRKSLGKKLYSNSTLNIILYYIILYYSTLNIVDPSAINLFDIELLMSVVKYRLSYDKIHVCSTCHKFIKHKVI